MYNCKGFNPRNKERIKRISSNNLFLLPSEGGQKEKELKRLASWGARRDSIFILPILATQNLSHPVKKKSLPPIDSSGKRGIIRCNV